jgi:hypothetical protein
VEKGFTYIKGMTTNSIAGYEVGGKIIMEDIR